MVENPEYKARRDKAYDLLGTLVDGVVARVCTRHYSAPTQEHQLTSKIADRIEEELDGLTIEGMKVSVHAQDFPDKGPGSMEKKSGADIYISVVAQGDGLEVNKGMMIQSKWDDAVDHGIEALREQSRKMAARTDSAYVWVYGPGGIVAVPSSDVSEDGIDYTNSKTVGELVAGGLQCHAGDPRIGRNLELPIGKSLTDIMERLAANKGLSIAMTDAVIPS